jgi:hypothetical protein
LTGQIGPASLILNFLPRKIDQQTGVMVSPLDSDLENRNNEPSN